MARCVAIMGASHVGKSTLLDQICVIAAQSGPQKPSAALRIAEFEFLGERWSALDCPGSIELLQDCQDALLAADVAVICVSSDPDQAVLAAPYLRAAEAAGTPAVLFVNRMDEARGRVRDIVAALQDYANHPLVLRQIPIRRDGAVVGSVDLVSERAWSYRENARSALIEIPSDVADRERSAREDMLEGLAEFDDWLFEEIVEERAPADAAVYEICARVMRENRAIPVMIGSASHGNGVVRLMKALRHEAPSAAETQARLAEAAGLDAPPRAATFRAAHRRHVGKTVWLRAFEAGLAPGATLGGGALGMLSDPSTEKPTPIAALEAGGVAAAVKSDHLQRGRLYHAGGDAAAPAWRAPLAPQIARTLSPIEERDDAKLSEALAKLAEDDPSLSLAQDSETGAHVVRAQGALHLSQIRQALAEVFGVETRDGPTAPDYRETITRPVDTHYRHKKQSGGAGQFADVKLTISPTPRGAGFVFEETVKGGAVPRNFIPAVEAGAREATTRGPLGFAAQDVSVTLTDGLHHSVDSSDMAFRIAARMGVSQAMSEAAPVLLEPFFAVRFQAPSVFAGALVQMVSTRRGQVLGFDRDPDAKGWDVFRALLPGAELEDLVKELRAATQGVGRYEAELDHYQEFYGKEADAVVEARRASLSR